jgi:gamma-glutamyl:cysteine ligase YbdK (ATP-grasp superfamily)
VHLNLPFADDAEFGRLHAAIRLLLPVLPALSAASPGMDGKLTGTLDNRLAVYRTNAARVPSVSGQVIPERAFTREEYEDRILLPIYRDLAPFDPEGILREEWANARGAIARFDRNTIEIRVLDTQECPAADLAIVAAIVAVLKALVEERWSPLAEQQAWEVAPLAAILHETIRDADAARIESGDYLRMFGVRDRRACTAGELWRHVTTELAVGIASIAPECTTALRTIAERGPLARRIAAALGAESQPERLRQVYRDLADCAQTGRLFIAGH